MPSFFFILLKGGSRNSLPNLKDFIERWLYNVRSKLEFLFVPNTLIKIGWSSFGEHIWRSFCNFSEICFKRFSWFMFYVASKNTNICFQIYILRHFYSDKTKKSVLITELRCKWWYAKIKYLKVLLIDFRYDCFINIIAFTIYWFIVLNHKGIIWNHRTSFCFLLHDW